MGKLAVDDDRGRIAGEVASDAGKMKGADLSPELSVRAFPCSSKDSFLVRKWKSKALRGSHNSVILITKLRNLIIGPGTMTQWLNLPFTSIDVPYGLWFV